jgi:cold shock CspA family protein
MRTHGTLVKWNEERGFGFIAVGQAGAEAFVHVSAFPRDGVRPQVGEMVSFELVPGDGGKRKAIKVQRPGAAPRASRPARKAAGSEPLLSNRQGIAASLAALLLLAGLGVVMLVMFRREAPDPALAPVAAPLVAPAAGMPDARAPVARPSVASPPVASLPVVSAPVVAAPAAVPAGDFRCDGRRHCSQMTSCAEAEFFLANCPDVQMDGNGDGEPCEQQWCQ